MGPGHGDSRVERMGVFRGQLRLDLQRSLEGLDRLLGLTLVELNLGDVLEDQAQLMRGETDCGIGGDKRLDQVLGAAEGAEGLVARGRSGA